MTLTAQGKVALHTRTYPLDEVNEAMDDSNTAASKAAASSSPNRNRAVPRQAPRACA